MSNTGLTSERLLAWFVLLIICLVIVNAFTMESVSALQNNKGEIIASIGMTENQVLEKMGTPQADHKERMGDFSCLCYPISFQSEIRASWRRKNLPFNSVKIIFYEGKVEEIYFFVGLRGKFQSKTCQVLPPLVMKL